MGLRASMLELAILGELTEPLHGYELRKRLTETLGPFRTLSFGSLYPALHRLEAKGFISQVDCGDADVSSPTKRGLAKQGAKTRGATKRAENQTLRKSGKPKRRQVVYRVTKAGETHLDSSLADAGVDDDSLPLTMGLMSKATPATRLTLLKARRKNVVARKEAGDKAKISSDFWIRSKAELDTSQAAQELEWLDRLIDSVGGTPELGEQNG